MTLELEDIQGNVLQGYGFEHAAYVSLEVVEDRDGRGLLGELLPQVTAATLWPKAHKPSSTVNIAVSHRGLNRLGVDTRHARHLPAGVPRRHGASRRATRRRRCKLAGELGARAAARGARRAGGVARASEPALRERVDDLHTRVAARPGVCVKAVHHARMQRAAAGWPREHFGFARRLLAAGGPRRTGTRRPGAGRPDPVGDGGWRPLEPGEFVLGYRDEDGGLPDAPVPPFARNGTFMVFRKLEQDVPASRD